MQKVFFTLLRGAEEVPPVKTNAFGKIVIKVNKTRTQLAYRLTIHQIKRVTQAHFHLGRRGVNGPVVAFLFGPTTPGISVDKGVITGTITQKDLTGPLKGTSIARLVQLMKTGKIYVNVHTEQHPEGEIRGQVKSVK